MEEKRPTDEQSDLKTAAKSGRIDKFNKKLLKIVAVYLCFIVLVTIIFQTVLMLSLIPSSSMADTLLPGDLVISSRYDVKQENINRYDILIFTLPNAPDKQQYIKRVIGMPGETIEIKGGKVYADGVELDDSFIKEPMEWIGNDTYVVPEGCYFFMGDNRNNSVDSRYWEECVPVENIEAKKKFIFLRLSIFGFKGEG